MDITVFFEVCGTIAFAFSGAFVAIESRLDMFGIWCAAVVTATGGGMVRDLILGNTPPLLFRDPVYAALATVIAFLTAVIYIHLMRSRRRQYILSLIDLLDAGGLAVFTVVGMRTAITAGYGDNVFLVCFVGVVTAVGGGVLRDLFAGRQPVIMQKDIYATASLVGSLFYYYLRSLTGDDAAAALAMALIFAVRIWSVRRGVNLPYARTREKSETERQNTPQR